jgi:hypothetical protein
MQASAVESALDALRPSLTQDGFSLRIGSLEANGLVKVVVEAGPDACIDCLVPEDLMVQIIEDAIRSQDASEVVRVEIVKEGFAGDSKH